MGNKGEKVGILGKNYDKEFDLVIVMIKKQNKRIEELGNNLIQLAENVARQKIIIMDLAKQIGLSPEVLKEFKKLDKGIEKINEKSRL